MVVQYLCTVIAHKHSMSHNMFEFLFGPWDMFFGLSFRFWVGFGFLFGIAFRSDFGSGGKLCNICSIVGFCFLCLGYVFEIGFRDGFWVCGWV